MTIFYSCVVDSGERSLWQLKVWILGLTHLAGVPSERLCVHVLGKNAAAEDYLAANGIRYKHVERFGDGRFCNKLSQCASSLFTGADYVFLCDCDTVCLENIEDCAHMQNISGKIVDMPYPPLSILEKIFDEYAVPKPPVLETLTGRSLSNNFNGGLYGIPLLLFDTLGRLWKEYAQSLLTNKNMKCLLGGFFKHIDQIAFSLAVNTAHFSTRQLPLEYNFPLHIIKKFLEKDPFSPLATYPFSVKVLHYHDCVKENQLLMTGNTSIDQSIIKINTLIKKTIC